MGPQDLIIPNLELVSLPERVLKLDQMVNDPHCSNNELTDFILQDTALCSELLGVVNSPYYSLTTKVESVPELLKTFGAHQLNNMAQASAIVGHFSSIPNGHASIDHYWQHNIVCATACGTIARKIDHEHHEQLFLAGLLHDIGKLLMLLSQPKLFSRVEKGDAETQNLKHLEQNIFGFTHGEAGAELLRLWNFPVSVIEPVQYHHCPAYSENYLLETSVVHLADAIANTIIPAFSLDDDIPIDAQVWEYIGLDEDQLEPVIDETRANLDHVMNWLYKPQAS